MRTAAATIKGFEVMRMIRRGHCLTCKPRVEEGVRFVNKLFEIFARGLTKTKRRAELRPKQLMQQCSNPSPIKGASLTFAAHS